MSLTKDEVVKMAREAGAIISPQWGVASNIGTATFERFATLCRAPLVAENERLEAEAEAGVFAHGRDMDWLRAERDAAIERADELGADKGTYFRLYEQACIQMTEKDKYGEHYRTLFNNADEANNRLIDERDALRAELGQYPEIQAMLMSENKQLRAEVEALERLLESVIGVDQVSAVNDARTAIAAGQKYLKENGK